MDYLVGVFCERPGGSDYGSIWDWYLFMNACLFFLVHQDSESHLAPFVSGAKLVAFVVFLLESVGH